MSQYAIDFNGTTTSVNCGSDASLDDLHDAAFTVEAWVKADGYGSSSYGRIVAKNGAAANGWLLTTNAAWGISATVYCATTSGNSITTTDDFPTDGSEWCHVAMTWDDSSYTSPRIWINGVEKGTENTARDGIVVVDASYDLFIGNRLGADREFDGEIAWVRISDTVRWTSGFTPDAKDAPPASDANTVEQWNFNEGTGTTAGAEESSPTNDGTIANGSWVQIAYNIAIAQGSYAQTGQAVALTHYGALQIITKGIGTPSTIKGFLTRGLAVGEAAATYELALAQGSYTLTGQTVDFKASRKMLAAQGSYTLTGFAAGFKAARKIAIAQGSYVLSGQDVIFTYTPVGGPTYTLALTQGSYALTGQALGFKVARKLALAHGVYNLTGQDTGLITARNLTIGQGSYALSGQAIDLIIARILALNYGAYALTGQSITFDYSGALPLVTPDCRTFLISVDNRVYVISAENRVYEISAENRTLIIDCD